MLDQEYMVTDNISVLIFDPFTAVPA
jgi:hypothetical protein